MPSVVLQHRGFFFPEGYSDSVSRSPSIIKKVNRNENPRIWTSYQLDKSHHSDYMNSAISCHSVEQNMHILQLQYLTKYSLQKKIQ